MKEKRIIAGSLIILGLLTNCQTNQTKKAPPKTKSFPTILDSSNKKTQKHTATWLSAANFSILFIGKWQDSIYPDYMLKYYPIPPPPPTFPGNKARPFDTLDLDRRNKEHKMFAYYENTQSRVKSINYQGAKISVRIDTNQRLKSDVNFNWDGPFYEAYPVLIENNDIETVRISFGKYLPIITEAKDSSGNWKPIEKMWKNGCGVGGETIILPPNEIVISSSIIYHGDFSTTLRLRMGDTFSNEFNGSINYRFRVDLLHPYFPI